MIEVSCTSTCPHTTRYVICVLILLYMCLHTTIYVSSYYYLCPDTTACVSAYYYVPSYVSSHYHMCLDTTLCVLILGAWH